MTTNERDLLRLINACTALGASGHNHLAIQLTATYLPKNILEQTESVLARMRSDFEIVPGLQDETIQTNPQPFDPEKLPGGRLPDPKFKF